MKSIGAVSLAFVLIEVCGVLGAEPRGIAELMKALEHAGTRFDAIRELEDLGLDAAPAVPQLIELLDSPDKSTRAAAADALGAVGKDATAAIPKLIERLGEPETPQFAFEVPVTDVGLSAAVALGAMGDDPVGPLVGCLADERPRVRNLAAFALGEIGPAAKAAVTSLAERLNDGDASVRQEAACALGRIGSGEGHWIGSLVGSLADKDDFVRAAAAEALGLVHPTTPTAVQGLIRALRDEEPDVQHEAAKALGRLGDDAVPAIPTLTDMLKSRKAYRYSHPVVLRPVAGTAARALGTLGPRAKEAMPALIDLIRDRNGTFERFAPDDKCDNYEARGEAAMAAARINPQSDELIRVLGQSLQEDDWIRGKVAVALAFIGPNAKGMVPLLIEFSKPNSRFPYELSCACAAVAIEPDNSLAITRMLDCLPPTPGPFDGDDWDLLRTAFERAGARSRPAIPILTRLVADVSEDQENAAHTLATFGPEAQSAIPALLDLLDNRWEHPRQEAIAALQQIASEKSPPLLAALKNRNANVRAGAVEVLGHFPGALPRITEALNEPSARVRLAALLSLGKLDGSAKPAIPQIRGLLQAESRSIREAAALALQKVEQR